MKDTINKVFQDFGINAEVGEVKKSASVSRYEIILKNEKIKKVVGVQKELEYVLKKEVRFIETAGLFIEIPNDKQETVTWSECITPLKESDAKVPFVLGKNIDGDIEVGDLTKTPHLLVAGATGSGKSVFINSLIASILLTRTPDEVKLLMIDPKKVELTNYHIPHNLKPVIDTPERALNTLEEIVKEMDERYSLFEHSGVRNIKEYNKKFKKLPYIVIIIDELADLMMYEKRAFEKNIQRITQLARACGIHLVVATQRPSTDIITGVIKANIPSRIAFATASQIDSRTILDEKGAEKLLGKGDMLYLPMGENHARRIQGAFLTDEEIDNVIIEAGGVVI